MLIRFVVKNLFSFKEETEFNLLPSKSQRLNHHKYQKNGIEVLKMTALYGANGSGKSNLVKAIGLFREMLLTGIIPPQFNNQKFKLSKTTQNEPVELAMEFVRGNHNYYYSVSINNGIIIDEYFDCNDEKQENEVIFHREYKNEETKITFYKAFEDNAENQVLKRIIEKDLLKNNQPLFTLLNTISNDFFIDIKVAYEWFNLGLWIVYPQTAPAGLAQLVDKDVKFKLFANNLMSSFDIGISKLKVEITDIEDMFGKDNQANMEMVKLELEKNPNSVITLTGLSDNQRVSVVKEGEEIKVKKLLFEHKNEDNEDVVFQLEEESDGTKRLLEYLPVLGDLTNTKRTFIIDEIERSIHPIIIKELISKFSKDEQTQGQLIFTTHESNLLDQEIFRQDEIWFAEKKLGATKLSPLSDFKENAALSLDKGYLAGRFGGIPFIGDLQNLNWHKFEEENLENQKLENND